VTEHCGAPTPDGPCALPHHRRGYHDANPPTLIVPRNDAGHPQVSISQFRRYGVTDMTLDSDETVRGCPRVYALTYGPTPIPEIPSPTAELGSVLHRALHAMEANSCGPEDALRTVWTPTLGFTDFKTALAILLDYLARGGPLTQFAVVATELDIAAQLYTDDQHGPIDFRGIIDNLSIDTSDPGTVRIIDYKSAARPVAADSLRGDVQLLGYVWLVRQWWTQQYGVAPDRIIAHLDLLRYNDIEIEYTDAELDVWHQWACAMAHTMLRDNAPAPIPNDGCTSCAVRWGCPAWRSMPGTAASVWGRLAGRPVEEIRDDYLDAEQISKILDHQVRDLRRILDAEARATGEITVGYQTWKPEPATDTHVDVVALAGLLLPERPVEYTTAVTASKASVERAAQLLEPSDAAAALATVRTVPAGTKISRRKTKTPTA
jgi:hypothetical protein